MVVKNKSFTLVSVYREVLNSKLFGANKQVKKSVRTKNRILDFFLKNGYWPSRLGKRKTESALGTRFENYISKESGSYDKDLRN